MFEKFLLLYHVIGYAQANENLAISGRYESCSHNQTQNPIFTDRNRQRWSYALVVANCNYNESIYVSIFLSIRPVHLVGYVVVYLGDCDYCNMLLHNFKVEVKSPTQPFNDSVVCGRFSGVPRDSGQPLRVNCDVTRWREEPINTVVIKPDGFGLHYGVKGAVSEVEVYALDYSENIGFYGCYADFEAEERIDLRHENCKHVCLKMAKKFMSFMRNGTCLCGSKAPQHAHNDIVCYDIVCEERYIMCAVEEIYPVYIAKMPQIFYLGCYRGNPRNKDLNNFIQNMTLIKCLALCAKMKMKYSYLMPKSTCGCRTEIDGDKLPEEFCNSTCSGNELIYCGGPNKEASVYSGCLTEVDDSPCTEIYKCQDDNIDEYGRCLGQCQDGFFGQHCIARDNPSVSSNTRALGTFNSRNMMKPNVIYVSSYLDDLDVSVITIDFEDVLDKRLLSESEVWISLNIVLYFMPFFVIGRLNIIN